MPSKVDKKKEEIVKAGYQAVDELIKVAKSKILKFDNDDEVAAEKMKNAAAAKRLCIEDALAILDRIEKLEEDLSGEKVEKVVVKSEEKRTDFRSAEERAGTK